MMFLKSFFTLRSTHKKGQVFRHYFKLFFILTILALLIESIFNYYYSVSVLERESEKTNTNMMTQYAANMDSMLDQMKEKIIFVLNYRNTAFTI